MKKTLLALLALMVTSGSSFAAPILPTSYDTPNGYTGSYQYWDDTYSGSGSITTSGATLSGGLGDLTDGIIATDSWFVTEAPVGAGPYVGWDRINPLITFNFATQTKFQTVGIYFDDANGAGGVSTPQSVIINGTSYAVSDPVGAAPFLATFDVSGLAATNALAIQLMRNNQWVFASEFKFEGPGSAPVPEPATILLFGTGIAGLAGIARRKRS